MMQSEAEAFFNEWKIHDAKVFKYRTWIDRYEYVTLTKSIEGVLEPDIARSTFECKKIKKDEFVGLMTSEELKFIREWTWHVDVKEMKTGGCTCGAWILKDNTYLHYAGAPGIPACKIYRRF